MNTALKILATFVIGVALGLFATWFFVFRGAMPGGVSDGPWKTNLSVGSASGDMATRASVAVHGLLALNRSETVYYTAVSDTGGEALDGRCDYLIAGRDPAARWWSITAYAEDDFLIPNPQNRYSISKNSVLHEAGGGFTASVSRKPTGNNVIPVADAPFSLTLRLYNPDPRVVADPAHAALLTIQKVACP
jgi:hypothetical protein